LIDSRSAAEIGFAFAGRATHSFLIMSDRQLILEAVQQMPEHASAEEILDELLLLNDVKKRLAKSERGEHGVPHEDVVRMLDSWIIK
jgi:predicted transcriptional regulator